MKSKLESAALENTGKSNKLLYGSIALVGVAAAVLMWIFVFPNPKTSPLVFANVEGTITLDGKPFPGAVVVFHPEAANGTYRSYRAQTIADKNGHYSIAIDEINPWNEKLLGVAVGPSRVTLNNPTRLPGRPTPGKVDPTIFVQQVPDRYKELNQTPLNFSIHPGSQTIDLSMTSQ